MTSPATHELVKSGKVKVVGAIYDVATGKSAWLDEAQTGKILTKVEAAPNKAVNAIAGEKHCTKP